MFFAFKLLRRIVSAAVLLVVVYTAVTAGRVVLASRHDDRGPADVIVVLGASQVNGRPSALARARLDHARDLYLGKAAPRIITVGGRLHATETTEADAARNYLISTGVPAAAVAAVGKGTDTRRELYAADELMSVHHWRTAVLVSDPWHSLRVASMARAAGIAGVTSPTRNGPANAGLGQEARYVARETVAYAAWSLFGRRFDRPGSQL